MPRSIALAACALTLSGCCCPSGDLASKALQVPPEVVGLDAPEVPRRASNGPVEWRSLVVGTVHSDTLTDADYRYFPWPHSELMERHTIPVGDNLVFPIHGYQVELEKGRWYTMWARVAKPDTLPDARINVEAYATAGEGKFITVTRNGDIWSTRYGEPPYEAGISFEATFTGTHSVLVYTGILDTDDGVYAAERNDPTAYTVVVEHGRYKED